jgi:phenylpyruvate tautomerase PptA (4-oxalocrotonate tautomerase family)
MLVHIALKQGDERGLQLGDCVHRAANAVLDLAGEGYFQIVTEQAQDLMAEPLQRCQGKIIAAIVLIYPTMKISDRKKRNLYGKISDSLESKLEIPRGDVAIGIIELPGANWLYAGDQMKLEKMMAGELP